MKFSKVETPVGCAIDVSASSSPTHPDCLQIWKEAAECERSAMQLTIRQRHCEIVDILVDACNHCATHGQDAVVRDHLTKARRLMHEGALGKRNWIFNRVLLLFVSYLLIGCTIAILWEIISPTNFWLSGPDWAKMPLNVATYCFGWMGYLLIGFSLAWLFNVVSTLRMPTTEKLSEHHSVLENISFAALGHVLFLILIIVALIFLEGRLDPVEDFALYEPPSGFFLGILAGFAEKRVRDLTSSLFDRL